MFFLLFGILGTNFFKGAFYSCVPYSEDEDLGPIKTKFDCSNTGGVWVNSQTNFDNVLNSMVALFMMTTTEGWINIMWMGVDAVGISYQPMRDYGLGWVSFFIAFIIVGSLFILNLFVGVVIDTFNNEKELLGKNHLLTET